MMTLWRGHIFWKQEAEEQSLDMSSKHKRISLQENFLQYHNVQEWQLCWILTEMNIE